MLIKKYLIKKVAILTVALATNFVWAIDDSQTAPNDIGATQPESTTSDSNVEEVRKPEGNIEDFWNAQTWSALNSAEQALWGKLGWTEINWQGDTQPPSENKTWAELNDEERSAADQLSYTEEIWNRDLVRQTDDNIEDFWNSQDWLTLTPAEQALWGKLGWTQESWEGKAEVPDSENKLWKELSDEERDIAQKLGYDEKSWDASANSERSQDKK